MDDRDDDRDDDRHAADRERKRRSQRYGPTTTNPGMRIVMRDLAHKAHEELLERKPDDERAPARDEGRGHRPRERRHGGRRHGRDEV